MIEDRVRSTGPLRAELDSLNKQLEQIEARQKKYFALYESDRIDSDALVQRLEELRKEAAGMSARKAEVEGQIRNCDSEPIELNSVRDTLKRFHELVTVAPPEQLKNLLRLVITEIEVTKDRKIDKTKIRFDESIRPLLEEETPSADTGTKGVSPIVYRPGYKRFPAVFSLVF